MRKAIFSAVNQWQVSPLLRTLCYKAKDAVICIYKP